MHSMQTDVTAAVILAAGQGIRLGERGRHIPKGFLRLGDRPIIEESIARLSASGITRVVIVTGHQAEFYAKLQADRATTIELVHNPRFADSGSMYSLWSARDYVRGTFMLLECDLIYETRALTSALGHPGDSVVLLSGPTGGGDEVFVETDRQGNLVGMSKAKADLGPTVAGELVGISKISAALFQRMLECAERRFTRTLEVAYETDTLVEAARLHPVPCVLLDDLLWAEIDDERHFLRAAAQVYPALMAKGELTVF